MVHWGRFPAFRHVRNELKKPHLTMKDADRGAVFMRWKEKFLVPDHRVQDISGASFAGESSTRMVSLLYYTVAPLSFHPITKYGLDDVTHCLVLQDFITFAWTLIPNQPMPRSIARSRLPLKTFLSLRHRRTRLCPSPR